MLQKGKIKLWQWLLLLIIGFMFPLYNILINNFLHSLNIQIIYYIASVMLTTVIFSSTLFLLFNHFRTKTGYEKRMDTAFILYVLSASFGSFFNNLTNIIGLFIIPFIIAYFLEIKNILNDFPRE
ncbi:hypothetical protein A3K64_01990 [Candidatus Micrarchaeota archaeon RBG_16_36_9]|nr:MAG: hypothetical protein A3K64_01990 [Candidatus Micrarchaeota archaeon RBG_16_36_9]